MLSVLQPMMMNNIRGKTVMEHLVQEEFGFREKLSEASEDEMDDMLTCLPQIMPPPSLVDDIMTAVARVALSEVAVSTMSLDALDEFPVTSMPGQYC
jgi:hypothetical protein